MIVCLYGLMFVPVCFCEILSELLCVCENLLLPVQLCEVSFVAGCLCEVMSVLICANNVSVKNPISGKIFAKFYAVLARK